MLSRFVRIFFCALLLASLGLGPGALAQTPAQPPAAAAPAPLNRDIKTIVNAERKGKKQVLIRPASKVLLKFLRIMQKHGYIGEFEIVDDHRSKKIVIELLGRINKVGVISPRYDLTLTDYEKWTNSILPSRQFGHLVISTNQGIFTHDEARTRHIGGKIIGFFY